MKCLSTGNDHDATGGPALTTVVLEGYEEGPERPTHCQRCGRPLKHSEALGKSLAISLAKMYGFCSPRCLRKEFEDRLQNDETVP